MNIDLIKMFLEFAFLAIALFAGFVLLKKKILLVNNTYAIVYVVLAFAYSILGFYKYEYDFTIGVYCIIDIIMFSLLLYYKNCNLIFGINKDDLLSNLFYYLREKKIDYKEEGSSVNIKSNLFKIRIIQLFFVGPIFINLKKSGVMDKNDALYSTFCSNGQK